VSRSTKGVFGIALMIAMVVPFLEGKCETLVMEKIWVKLLLGWGGDKDDLEIMCSFTITRLEDPFGVPVGD
jgi:hypothetical protein